MSVQGEQQLLHYRLVEKIGEGGMGVVWRAVDTTLGREVAVKILPDAVAHDHERLARFEREAKLLASLNHPNIATVHGLHEAGGIRFLAMELVAGEDLSLRLARGALPVDEALDVAGQVCEALAAAHDQGVVHRDLKPANVKLDPAGTVKVLDFGLAKAESRDPSSGSGGADPSLSPTLTSEGTRAGTILGTAAYMSPEQARGKTVDRRADIWAFGCLLYEMLSGRRTFPGDTATDVLASVVKEEPRWELLPDATPWRVRELLKKCLAKNVGDRLRDAGDARLELVTARANPAPWPSGSPQAARRGFVVPALALLAGALLATAGFWISGALRTSPQRVQTSHLSVPAPAGLYASSSVRLSSNGRVLAYVALEKPGSANPLARLVIRPLASAESRTVPGSEGVRTLAFSPDGQWIAFVAPIARQSSRLRLFKAPVDGSSPPLEIADWDPEYNDGILWHPDGEILGLTLTTPSDLVRISAENGEVRPPLPVGREVQGSLWLQHVLPDDSILARLSVWDRGFRTHVAVIDPKTGAVTVVVEDGATSAYLPTGHILFSRGENLLAAPFDLKGRTLLAGPVSISGDLASDAYSYATSFDLARDGTLAYLAGGRSGGRRRLALVDEGRIRAWSDDELQIPGGIPLDVSLDGRWLALTVMNEDGLFEIWGSEVQRPALRRLAGFPTMDCSRPVLSANGSRLVFPCNGETAEDGLYEFDRKRTDPPRLLVGTPRGEAALAPLTIAPAGDYVLAIRGASGSEIYSVSLDGDGPVEPRLVMDDAGRVWDLEIAPSGSKVAYVSNRSGRFEVFVREWNGDGPSGAPVLVDAARSIRWIPGPGRTDMLYTWTDGGELTTFQVADDLVVSAPTSTRDLSALEAQILTHDILPDGKMLAVLRGDDETPPRQVNVVLGFDSEVETLAR